MHLLVIAQLGSEIKELFALFGSTIISIYAIKYFMNYLIYIAMQVVEQLEESESSKHESSLPPIVLDVAEVLVQKALEATQAEIAQNGVDGGNKDKDLSTVISLSSSETTPLIGSNELSKQKNAFKLFENVSI